jgi:hypothetical protein
VCRWKGAKKHANIMYPKCIVATKNETGHCPLPSLPYRTGSEPFVGRSDVLEWIHNTFSENEIVVLSGLGGIGKTRTAVEYIYEWRDRDNYEVIGWINARTKETIEMSFLDIAQQLVRWKSMASPVEEAPNGQNFSQVARDLRLTGLIDQTTGSVSGDACDVKKVVHALREWFSEYNGNWLLVFDNADDLEFMRLQEYFPRAPGGRILVTSRVQESGDLGVLYLLPPLSKDDGLQLLLRKSQRDEGNKVLLHRTRLINSIHR